MNQNFQKERLLQQLQQEGIHHSKVLAAIAETPREIFVPPHLQPLSYENEALPIDCNQTISQPYVVARMTEAVYQNKQHKKVLEIGTGSGYQAAILSHLYDEVYSVERIAYLLHQAKKKFKQLNLTNIYCQVSDGYQGWSEHAPYDAIIVTAAAKIVPEDLKQQLRNNGKLIIPVETQPRFQELQLITRRDENFTIEHLDAVTFVPLLSGTENKE